MFAFALDPIDFRALANRSSTAQAPSVGSTAAHFRKARRFDDVALTFIQPTPSKHHCLTRGPRSGSPADYSGTTVSGPAPTGVSMTPVIFLFRTETMAILSLS